MGSPERRVGRDLTTQALKLSSRADRFALPALAPRNIAIGRIVAGSVYVVFPAVLVRPWTGTADDRGKALGRAIGVRDLALGLGALRAIDRGAQAQQWFVAAALADGADALITLREFRHLPRLGRWVILGAAITGAITSAVVARAREHPPST